MTADAIIPEYAYKENVKKPGLFWLATEGLRAGLELGSFFPYKLFADDESEVDLHPVIALPGFLSSDASTKPMRDYLEKLGYHTFGWGLGRNFGNEADLDPLLDLADSLYSQYRMKISLIGWSLGGIFARQMAKANPHLIRQVITLSSPFNGVTEKTRVGWIHKLITNADAHDAVDPAFLADIPRPAPVPTTAIYTKQDGIVPWPNCMELEPSDIHQNIEVIGSHMGLGFNPLVMEIIKDRLQYRRENWVKYKPSTRFTKAFSKIS